MIRSSPILIPRRPFSSYLARPENRTQIHEFVSKYASRLQPGERLADQVDCSHTLSGRIISPIRHLSSNLLFFHIENDRDVVQVLADASGFADPKQFHSQHACLKRGDIVSCVGYPGKTRRGELSLFTRHTSVLSPSAVDIPMGRGDGKYAVKDQHFLHKHREVDLIVHGREARDVFRARQRIIHSIRQFLLDRDFVEVETPVLGKRSNGAFAKPFQTQGSNLSLRIAPELPLKRLIVGGYERVFEIGKVFRDEGTSLKHNPEFTTCEFYQAYANAQDLQLVTQELLKHCFDAAMVSETQPLKNPRVLPQSKVDFDCNFPSISIADVLESFNRFSFSDPESLTTDAVASLLSPCTRSRMSEQEVQSLPKLLDKLIGQEIEDKLVNPTIPTFLCDHPKAISPLAKEQANRLGVCERFELFVNNYELCNAYSELNDPSEQRERFQEQMKYRLGGDNECPPPDEDFCHSLEYGMPPTAGWGMGIDRLVMLLLEKSSIRDVILFPF